MRHNEQPPLCRYPMAKKSEKPADGQKFCFVVSPIGSPASAERKRSNGYLREVITPVAEEAGYRVERADHDKSPGMVTEGIVNKIVEADLVIADLHGPNPNVMYEVAIRHATGLPIIQMMPEGDKLPFDIGGLNTVFYDPEVDGLARWRLELRAAIDTVAGGKGGDNPVSRAGVYRALEQRSDVDANDGIMQILRRMEGLEATLRRDKLRNPHRDQDRTVRHMSQLLENALRELYPDVIGILGNWYLTPIGPNTFVVESESISPPLVLDEHPYSESRLILVWAGEVAHWAMGFERAQDHDEG